MRFTERIRDRLKQLTRRRWAYKAVRELGDRLTSLEYNSLPRGWGTVYIPQKWVAAPDHSLLMVFANEDAAWDWLKWVGGKAQVWRVEVQGVCEMPRLASSYYLTASITSFWGKPNSKTHTFLSPDGTLGATKVKLVRKIA